MLERRTFIVRIHAHDALPIIEDVSTGEQVRLPNLASVAEEMARRLGDSPDEASAAARPDWPERP